MREGIVAGLEPFIDTIVVCTFTALIILSTGIWNRDVDVSLDALPAVTEDGGAWHFADTPVTGDDWRVGDTAILIVAAHERDGGFNQHKVEGLLTRNEDGFFVRWESFASDVKPRVTGEGFYKTYIGATLTAKAFDSVSPGLGKWLISIAAWMFAISTMISWAYYGEQGVVFLAGDRAVFAWKVYYCALIIVATLGFIQSDADLDNVTGVGTAVLVIANIPICWFFGYQAMRAYKDYVNRLKSGRMGPDHPPPSLDELLSGP